MRGLGLHDHVCLPFEDDEGARSAILEFLGDGRRLGQRLIYAGGTSKEELHRDLAALPARDRLLEDGALRILSLSSLFALEAPIDADAGLRAFAAATEEALRDGYTGLRVASSATSLIADPAHWEACTRWELIADRYMASMPLAAMCCYDRRALPKKVVTDMACVHPAVRGEEAPFRLYAEREHNALMLGGEVDYFCVDDLDRLLSAALLEEGGRTVLDLSELRFIDQYGVARIVERARATEGGQIEVRNVPPHARRVSDLLGAGL